MRSLWNDAIAPAVSAGVLKGAAERAGDGGQKVANTALYVLMQRAVVSGCPLTGYGRYFKDFWIEVLYHVPNATKCRIKAYNR